MIEAIPDSTATVEYGIPDSLEVEGKHLETATKAATFSLGFFRSLATILRDKFYLPGKDVPAGSYLKNSGNYATEFTNMIRGTNPHLDPTFPHLPQIIEQFTIRDIPVTVKLEEGECIFKTRVIESKETVEGKKLRLILFTFYDNIDGKGAPWDPLTTDEMSSAPLEVLKAFSQNVKVHSMMTFSMGNFIFDGLKNISDDDHDLIPHTLILNRPLASISKVAPNATWFPQSYLAYQAAYYLGLDADPEREMLKFFERVQSSEILSMEGRKVTIIEAVHDRYFSGCGAFDANYRESLEQTGVEAYQGAFMVPLVEPRSHHAIRMDLLINNKNTGTLTANFLPIKENESLPSSIVNNLLTETDENDYHTVFIAGGNKDTVDSVTYLQAAPLLSAFVQLNTDH
jgi:hypothetical protein